MTPRDRALRKELLLIKGDALRLQLGMEMRLMRRRLSVAGLALRGAGALRGLLGLFGATAGRRRGWLRALLQGWSVARSLVDLYKRL